MIREILKQNKWIKKLIKTPGYVNLRQYFPMAESLIRDDRGNYEEAEKVWIDWPADVPKPVVGIVQDYEDCPRWTKYINLLENNAFPYGIYPIHASDWVDRAKPFDVIAGIVSNEYYHLQEMRKKYYFLERFLGKACYPSSHHINLYENKSLEAHISKIYGLPFAPTHIFNNKEEALRALETMRFPVISKIDPGSGSVGVEWVENIHKARRIIRQAFSQLGRATYTPYFRQKNHVYFQDFIPNDGYDIRVILVDNRAFGYYRKTLDGDFRASGMNQVEWGDLPEEAVRIAWKVNKVIQSPLLVVDMVHGQDGRYYIIEFSPMCRMDAPRELQINAMPGFYIIEEDESIHFQAGKYWVHEMALREFLLKDYLPGLQH